MTEQYLDAELKNWLSELPASVIQFLESMQGTATPGFYKYSLTGDLFDEKVHWGLGNTVFAVKILHALQRLSSLSKTDQQILANFIQSFQTSEGLLFDSIVARQAWFVEKYLAIRQEDFNNFWHYQTKVAETRQAVAVLKLLDSPLPPSLPTLPTTVSAVTEYLDKLDWTHPWGAGSHFSHLLFFLHHSQLNNKSELINHAVTWVSTLQHAEDGAWYKGQPNLQQEINGAMKIITGFKVIEETTPINFKYAEQLVDTCLQAAKDNHACDNFNVIYTVHYASKLAPGYRLKEIKAFALARLAIYKTYYFPKAGGFSFRPGRANDRYYGAKISRGLPEADIHGTVLFIWGISIIVQILGWEDIISLNELIS